jgi:putative peptidoglycan lipid II flippase
MAAFLYVAVRWLAPYLAAEAPIYTQAATLAILVGAAAVIYFVVAFGIGGADLGMVRRSLKRGRARQAAPSEIAPPE